MQLEFTDEAQRDLEALNQPQLEAVKQKLAELREQPTSHDDAKLIRVHGRDLYRLAIKEERGGEIDHRAIYDIVDNTIRIYSIFPRDRGYDTDL